MPAAGLDKREETRVGGAAALSGAALWAITNLLLRRQVLKMGGSTANTWRNVFSTLCYLGVFFAFRGPRDLLAIPRDALLVLLLAVLLSMVIGDILQFMAIQRLGIALAMPIASSYPFLTLFIAALALGERLTARAVGGAILVIVGVILVALPRRALIDAEGNQHRALTTNHWIGVGIAIGSALCAAAAVTLTRTAIVDIDILAANMIRLPFGAALCALISTAERRKAPWDIERGSYGPLFLAGLASMGSGIAFLTAVKFAGAAKTATLNASAPLFGMIGAIIFLAERPTRRNIVGAIIAFIGITLVV
jgi:drug/metabolite transporter (DMT)-like permease